jgi:hypothetical protein
MADPSQPVSVDPGDQQLRAALLRLLPGLLAEVQPAASPAQPVPENSESAPAHAPAPSAAPTVPLPDAAALDKLLAKANVLPTWVGHDTVIGQVKGWRHSRSLA